MGMSDTLTSDGSIMTEFHIGDQVRITEEYLYHEFHEGKVGTVIQTGISDFEYCLVSLAPRVQMLFLQRELELVADG